MMMMMMMMTMMMEQAHDDDDDDDDDAQEMITSQLGCFFLWTKVREKGATVVLHIAAACSLSSSSSFFCSDNILDLGANLFCNLKWRERNGRRACQKPTNI
jgi:hypothetical protein